MDTVADPDICFDDKGICNYYHEYNERKQKRVFNTPEHAGRLYELIKKIKAQKGSKDYDCIIGVSGGVDSTYLAYLAKRKFGLNPLAVHLDNGWNSELAVMNIKKALDILDIDLFTHVLNWEEFKDLQLSFLKASTPDGEIPTDHAIFALLFKMAAKMNIKFILNGNNFITEGIMPRTWSYGHIDWPYIKGVHKKFGSKKLSSYPRLTVFKYLYYTLIKRIRIISVLNYIDYQKDKAMKVLEGDLGWKYYGGKHYESVYTRFYQGHVLPEKFKIDKRKAHLSTLVFAGQMDKAQALEELKKDIYPEGMLEQDKDFVMKKFGVSETEFDELMKLENRTFLDYPSSYKTHRIFRQLLDSLRKKKIVYS